MDQEDKPTIDNMPDEVLVEIFSFFSPKLLKISALVCSRYETTKLLFWNQVLTLLLFRWNNLIGQSPELMKNFRLNLVPGLSEVQSAAASIATLTRSFQNLKIDSLDGAVPEILQKLNNIRALEIARSSIQRQELVDALASMSHLNTLKADELRLVDVRDTAIEPVKLNKLKYLSLQHCSGDILSLFSTTTLETIEISSPKYSKWTASAYELVKKLLMSQPALQSLSLHDANIANILEKDVTSKFPFHLQAFKTSTEHPLKTTSQYEYDYDEEEPSRMDALNEAIAIRQFLQLHKGTLKTLVWLGFQLQDESVLTLNSLTNLESLDIPFNIDFERSKDLQPFANVKRFSTQCFTISPRNNNAFGRLFPAMNTLRVELFRDTVTDVRGFPYHDYPKSVRSFLNYISEQFPGLKELVIPNFSGGYSQNLKFKNLKSLKFGWVRSSHELPAFIEKHADTLESLEIGLISQDSSPSTVTNTIDTIQSCTKLKRISIINPNPISLFKNKISRNRNRNRNRQYRYGIYVLPVAFKFPDDDALFQGKCVTCDEELIGEFNASY